MINSSLIETKVQGQSPAGTVPSADPVLAMTVPSIQRLLDVISSIIAEEYITIAKQNPTVFSGVTSGKMGQSPSGTVPIFPHNDGR